MTSLEAPGLTDYTDGADAGALSAAASSLTAVDTHDYRCIGCRTLLFDAEDAIDHADGSAFCAPVDPGALTQHADCTGNDRSVQLRCAACGSHVGHVFPDGPWPTGLRYQIDEAVPALLVS